MERQPISKLWPRWSILKKLRKYNCHIVCLFSLIVVVSIFCVTNILVCCSSSSTNSTLMPHRQKGGTLERRMGENHAIGTMIITYAEYS